MQSVLEILEKTAEWFASKGVPNPKLDAQLIVAHALGCKRLELFLRFDEPLSESRLEPIRKLVKRRGKREPLQHIIGSVDFFGATLKCDARALVPRSETETLCEIACKKFDDVKAPYEILDLGTGSGAIAVALANHYENAHIDACDLSDEAIDLARENAAKTHNVNVFKSDWFSEVEKTSYDLIVANPPYLTQKEVETAEPEVRLFDPHSALESPDDGLADLRKILAKANDHLRNGGFLLCECGLGQPKILAKEAEKLGFEAEIAVDMSQRERFLICKKPL